MGIAYEVMTLRGYQHQKLDRKSTSLSEIIGIKCIVQ